MFASLVSGLTNSLLWLLVAGLFILAGFLFANPRTPRWTWKVAAVLATIVAAYLVLEGAKKRAYEAGVVACTTAHKAAAEEQAVADRARAREATAADEEEKTRYEHVAGPIRERIIKRVTNIPNGRDCVDLELRKLLDAQIGAASNARTDAGKGGAGVPADAKGGE